MKLSLKAYALGAALRDAHLGMGEVGGNNRGPYVRGLLADVNPPLAEGAPWCAAAVQSWFDTPAKALRIPNPLDLVRREALVADYFELLRSWQVTIDRVEPGDLVCFEFHRAGRWNHIGLVVHPPEPGSTLFTTVEGNTSAESDRDGDAVAVKNRHLDGGYRVVFLDPERTVHE